MAYIARVRILPVALFLVIYPLAGMVAAVDLPSIAVDKLEDDYGDVYAGRQVEKRFVVANTGQAPLALESIETTCGCTTAVAKKTKLDPGEKTEIVVTYDTTDLNAGKTTQAVRINTNVPSHPVVSVRLYANIVRDVVLDPQSLVNKIPRGKHSVIFSLVAKNNSYKPVTIRLAKTRGAVTKALFRPDIVEIEPKNEKRFSIELSLDEQENGNFYRGAVFIVTDHPTEREIILPCLIRIAQR